MEPHHVVAPAPSEPEVALHLRGIFPFVLLLFLVFAVLVGMRSIHRRRFHML